MLNGDVRPRYDKNEFLKNDLSCLIPDVQLDCPL